MGISVSIIAGEDEATSAVSASGSVQHVITELERQTFGIADAPLKRAVEQYFGKAPNDAYVRSPTPWNDLYKTYGWSEVQTILVVKGAQLRGLTSEPVIVATKELVNDSSKRATFNAGISDQVTFTSKSTWSQTDTIQVGQKFSYQVDFKFGNIGGETSLDYSQSWGQGGSESVSTTVGTETGVSVELDPGEKVTVELTASRGSLKARITYRAYLTGYAAVNYNPTFKGHHFWALPISQVMAAAGLDNSREYTEDIEIGYYSNAKIVLKDAAGELRAEPVALDNVPVADRIVA